MAPLPMPHPMPQCSSPPLPYPNRSANWNDGGYGRMTSRSYMPVSTEIDFEGLDLRAHAKVDTNKKYPQD